MRTGNAPDRLVKGICSPEEAQALIEEGHEVMPLPDFANTDS